MSGSDKPDKAAPRAPKGLEAAGRSLWRRMVQTYVFDAPWELAVLESACRQADDVARLEEVIAADGVVTAGSRGQPRLAQAVTEVRQGRIALARLLETLKLPPDDEPDQKPARNGRSRRAQAAAERRWRLERGRRGA